MSVRNVMTDEEIKNGRVVREGDRKREECRRGL